MAVSWCATAGSSKAQCRGGRCARRCSRERAISAREGRAAMTSGPRLIESAALVPVYRDRDGHVRLVLIRRGAGGVHGGHLAFPGGKRDPDDASIQDTAVREAEEEIGLSKDEIEVLCALAPIDTRTSGFRIHPFLARI